MRAQKEDVRSDRRQHVCVLRKRTLGRIVGNTCACSELMLHLGHLFVPCVLSCSLTITNLREFCVCVVFWFVLLF